MSTVLTTLMQRALYELDVGFVVPNADISAFAATSFTAARFFQNTNMSADFLQLKQAGAVRAGAASSADFYRPLGTLTNSSGVVTQVGPNWSDTTVGSEEVEVWYYGVRRDQEVLKSLNRVTEFQFVTSMTMLSTLSRLDGGMEKTTDTDWTDILTPSTSAKTTTQSTQIIPFGPRAYQIANDAVNEGTRSTAIVAGQSRQVSAFAVVQADAGTASFQLYNSTGSSTTDMGDAVTASYRIPVLLAIRNQALPSTCKAVALNMIGQESTANLFWNQVGLYKHDSYTVQLPSFVTESFMAPRLYWGRPRVTLATNVYDAKSIDFLPMVENQDYRLVINHADAEPYKVQFLHERCYDWPVFMEYRRPLSDLTTFAAETDSTTGPLHQLLPAFKKDLLETVYNAGPRRHPDWQAQHNLASEQLTRASRARPMTHMGPPKPIWYPRLSAS